MFGSEIAGSLAGVGDGKAEAAGIVSFSSLSIRGTVDLGMETSASRAQGKGMFPAVVGNGQRGS